VLIEVKETHPPTGSRRSGTVVTIDGAQFDCWPNLMRTIQVGKRYDVETSTNERGYTSITKATPANGAAPVDAAPSSFDKGSGLPGASAGEAEFVGRALAALILKGDVIYTKKSLYDATLLLRDLYGATFRNGNTKGNSNGSH
jgi:hypothetical protein